MVVERSGERKKKVEEKKGSVFFKYKLLVSYPIPNGQSFKQVYI